MILVTGGTGFIGRHLVSRLKNDGYEIRLLLHPSKKSPKLPKNISVEVALASLTDRKGIQAALKNVDSIYHLAGTENLGSKADLQNIDIEGTKILTEVSIEHNIKRFIFLSHLGANSNSAFPLLKAKGLAENVIKNSGINFTIIRSAVVFGDDDNFSTRLAKLIKFAPGFLLVPDEGEMLLQPIWIEDLISCLVWTLELEHSYNQTYEVGGPEFLKFKAVLQIIMEKIRKKRLIISIKPFLLHTITEILEGMFKKFPTSVFWLDYLSEDRICSIDNLVRLFNIAPSRFIHRLDYLNKKS
jgi:NADH dehydrogenase